MKYLLTSLLSLGVLHAEPVSLFDGKTLAEWQVGPDDSIKIRRIGADELVIPKKKILAHDISKRSLMPEGLIDGFADQQVSDWFAYLKQLK